MSEKDYPKVIVTEDLYPYECSVVRSFLSRHSSQLISITERLSSTGINYTSKIVLLSEKENVNATAQLLLVTSRVTD